MKPSLYHGLTTTLSLPSSEAKHANQICTFTYFLPTQPDCTVFLMHTNILNSSLIYVLSASLQTEDSKERAIAKHSIYISGKQLLIFRIDAPRTTVVRVSNINSIQGKIRAICSSLGEVKAIVFRSAGTGDVHFKLCEWPNMLHILNR